MYKRKIRIKPILVMLFVVILSLCGCSTGSSGSSQTGNDSYGNKTSAAIRILSGSENKELGDILEKCAEETGVNIEMTYKGSVDIMNILKGGAEEYDAVWPASSIWISLGDTQHIVKYNESISTTPVVFGIKKSLAEKLGFTEKDVSVKDILEAIRQGELTFCMTSATQSNSGASAYIGFLYALLDKSEALSEEDLADEKLRMDISELLNGVDRSSGSSDWLKEMFVNGDFDAMVNYECLIIDANEELVASGREPLYVVYPYDGLSLADSPLAYLDHGDSGKQEKFLKIQEYLLSDEVQNEIQKTGRRTGFGQVSEENKSFFPAEWGIDTERILSPITMPSEKVLMKALNLYQTSFRKPSLTVYCLDYSGSMEGEGNSQLVEAMAQVLIQENAEANLLQAEPGEINIVITFGKDVKNVFVAEGSDEESLEKLYLQVKNEEPKGGTDMYAAALKALEMISDIDDIDNYSPAIIMMTDGVSGDENENVFINEYKELEMDIPIFSIMFGDAVSYQLDNLAELTNARVFDGREDLIGAFRSVKGYN